MFRRPYKAAAFIVLFALLWPSGAAAQNTSGVSGPDVRSGETEIGYRAAYSIDGETRDVFGHRLHVQHAIDDRWRLRAILLQSDLDGDLRLRSVQGEAMMQFIESERSGGWDSAVRFDGTIPTDGDRPGRARIGWLNSVAVGERWQVRGDLFVSRQFGELAGNELTVEVRAEATYKLPLGVRVGPQVFATARTDDLTEQQRQLGFVVKGDLTKRLSYETGMLFGLSPEHRDADLRLFLSYAF